MCLPPLIISSPSFFLEMTNIVATHCGCSHVADEPKQLVSCLKNTKGSINLIASIAIWIQGKLFFLILEKHLGTPNSDSASPSTVSVKTAAYAQFN